jgi:hypothetical protein
MWLVGGGVPACCLPGMCGWRCPRNLSCPGAPVPVSLHARPTECRSALLVDSPVASNIGSGAARALQWRPDSHRTWGGFLSIQSPLSQARHLPIGCALRFESPDVSNTKYRAVRMAARSNAVLENREADRLGVCGRLSPTNYEPQYWLSWCYWYGPCISSRAASIRCRVPSIFHCVHLPLHTAAHLSVGSLCYCEAVELRGGAGRGRAASGDELSSWTLRCQRGHLPKNACGRAHKCDTTEDCLLYKKAGG